MNSSFAAFVDDDDITTFTVTEENDEEKLQNYVVSTAKQYFYKRSYTDYGQYSMDDKENANGITTFNFRNMNVRPEDLNYTNNVMFDCSSFVTNVYMNALGYWFGDYYNIQYTDIFNDSTDSVMVAPDSLCYFDSNTKICETLNKNMNNLYNGTTYTGKSVKLFPLATSVIEKNLGKSPSKGVVYDGLLELKLRRVWCHFIIL